VSDWDHRQLCSDGACVGLIGDDGTCKVCGRAAQNWGDERKRGMVEASADEPSTDESSIDEDEDDDDDDDDDDDADDDGGADGDDDDDEDEDDEDEGDEDDGVIGASAVEPGEWGKRTLCPDGGCVGVIGVDGKCKACGRAAA
jgi:hypothetical protein